MINIPIDTNKYGTWFFKPNGDFKEIRDNDSIAYGKWSYNEPENTITFQLNSSNYITIITPTNFTKQITSLDSENMIFKTKWGTESNTIYQKEIFEHNN